MSTAENKTAQTVTDEPEKLDLRSLGVPDERRTELLALFPEARTEGGKIDFDRLRLALGETVDVGKERYGMNWPGKADCFRTIQIPSVGTLRPAPQESVNFDTTENLIIEGDNLEVLKLLQKSYLGKIKMIYLDPPYNTGNDFIYPDNYAESLETYLAYTGQVDAKGKKFGTNTDSDGRFHSKWLNMMYPRLYLARNLLRADGVIFVSIDDQEVDNLRGVLNEIFGAENFIAQMIWEGAFKNDARQIGTNHEYVVVFGRNRNALPSQWSVSKEGVEPVLEEVARLRAEYGDNYDAASDALAGWFKAMKATPSFAHRRFRYIDKIGAYKEDDPTAPGGRRIDLVNPKTGKILPLRPNRGWVFDQVRFGQMVNDGRITFVTDNSIMVRRYLHETDAVTPQSVFYQPARSASERLTRLMGGKFFDFPKDEAVLQTFIEMATKDTPDAIVLDFFAGSGSTAHAVVNQNQIDQGNRRFVLVQLPEKCAPESEAAKAGYGSIADVCKARVRKVFKSLDARTADQLSLEHQQEASRGFRVFKLAESNFSAWDSSLSRDAPTLQQQLALHVDHIRQARTNDDILYELLLKSGFPLTTPVEKKTVKGKTIYSAAGGALVICLDRALTLDVIRAIADMKPERVVCLDEGFAGNDQLKTNAVQTFKTKGVTSFKTV